MKNWKTTVFGAGGAVATIATAFGTSHDPALQKAGAILSALLMAAGFFFAQDAAPSAKQ